ncbi:DUF2309 domain-containing protein [Longibacter salinarum]|uniref:Probable inorganic carbon transporter subunit DabA n=1 Tax=Longibacter salinarum TaxID=1850348 RepID=A0A2A8CWE9_9BACT|nr:DUF2309 domain-containing protein [Longibacter salinarum]
MSIEISVLRGRIENAAEAVGPLWPLRTFNSANPLSGFETLPFDEAVQRAGHLFRGRGYPSPTTFRHAWERGAIQPNLLRDRLKKHDITSKPEETLATMEANDVPSTAAPSDQRLNRLMSKWLAAFFDHGQAAWPMPNRADGFFASWRILAPFDRDIPGIRQTSDLPSTKLDAFIEALDGVPESEWETIFTHHLAALPGWVGLIRWQERGTAKEWGKAKPITLGGYLAVRLTLARLLDEPLLPEDATANGRVHPDDASLPAIWLSAWEETYRQGLLDDLATSAHQPTKETGRPDAQLVFCIDVRSEIIRRHLEATGPYETHGYAGFFGIPMEHEAYAPEGEVGERVKACPPIVDPRHRIAERVAPNRSEEAERYNGWAGLNAARQKLVKTLKNDVAAAFGFVEGSGGLFGVAMALRTLLPHKIYDWIQSANERIPRPSSFTEVTVDRDESLDEEDALAVGLSDQVKVVYAEAAFRLMGWTETFAPIVVFTGHGSQTPNNPFKSSLDCGACAGNPGGPNARVLAAICNDSDVRDALRDRGIDIPDDTVFLAGEHNTTTDEVRLYVDEENPPVDADALARLRADLTKAREKAAAERVGTMDAQLLSDPSRETERRAADWSETRPEWGLAGNAAFIVGPRRLTNDLDLDGRSFLHSYDWRVDESGTALETILTGPLVVGEWINMQYYFSTVDNAVYGSGSKITHNVSGKVGVVQGNGGDLMTGLPLQSLYLDDDVPYHDPLRLFAVLHAPVERVGMILQRQDTLKRLFDHEWVALTVMDPQQDNTLLRYEPGGTWASVMSDDRTVPELLPEAEPTS